MLNSKYLKYYGMIKTASCFLCSTFIRFYKYFRQMQFHLDEILITTTELLALVFVQNDEHNYNNKRTYN